jgi:hypothetical protein
LACEELSSPSVSSPHLPSVYIHTSYFLHRCDKIPGKNNLKKKDLWVHGFRVRGCLDRTIWWQESGVEECVHLMADRKQSERHTHLGPTSCS